jgi:small multidrug resistance family-3 protein
MLEVVQHQQERPRPQRLLDHRHRVAPRAGADAELPHHQMGDQLGGAHLGQVDEAALDGRGGVPSQDRLDRQAGLAHPARAQQGHDPAAVEQGDDRVDVPLPPDGRGGRARHRRGPSRRGGSLRCHLPHLAHELVPAPVDRADQPLGPPVVADGPAGALDPARQRRLGHEARVPHLVEQLLLRDQAVALAQQQREDVEHLGLNRSPLPTHPQLDPVDIELAALEAEDRHARSTRTASSPGSRSATTRPRASLRAVSVARALVLFVLAAAAEIGGAWLVWQGVREHRGVAWAGAGIVALAAYGFVATLQEDPHFGRILAAYGGIFVAGSLAWGIVADGFRPDRWDLLGAGVCLLGVAVIMFAPRSA